MKKSVLVFPVRAGCIWLARKKRKVGLGFYNGWGGKLERGEGTHPDRGAIREFSQESSAKADTSELELVAIIRFYEEEKLVFECWVYFLHSWEGEIRESDEMGAPDIFSLDEIPYGEMMPGDAEWLPLVLQGNRINGRCYYNAGNKKVLKFEYTPL